MFRITPSGIELVQHLNGAHTDVVRSVLWEPSVSSYFHYPPLLILIAEEYHADSG